MNAEKLKGNLDLLLLSVLASGPGHGYTVISRLRERSAGAFDLPEGTVYPALHRLEAAGLLASGWEVVAGRRRRVYRLTLAGQESLAEEARRWHAFSGSVSRVIGRAQGDRPSRVSGPAGLPTPSLTTARPQAAARPREAW